MRTCLFLTNLAELPDGEARLQIKVEAGYAWMAVLIYVVTSVARLAGVDFRRRTAMISSGRLRMRQNAMLEWKPSTPTFSTC